MGAVEDIRIRPANEYLPWLMPLTDNVVVCKDSTLLASFQMDGIDADSISNEELDGACDVLDRAFKPLAMKPATLWFTVHRRKTFDYPSATFESPIAQRLDDIRRAAFLSGENYVNSHYMSIGMAPSAGRQRYFDRLKAFLADGENPLKAAALAVGTLFSGQQSFAWSCEEMSATLRKYEEIISSVRDPMRDLALRRLDGGDLYGFLRACASPASNAAPILPHAGWSLDTLLSENAIQNVGSDLLYIDGGERPRYAAALSLKGWPTHTMPGMLDSILSVPGEISLSHTFRVVDSETAKAHISSVRRFNDVLKYGIKAYIGAAFGQGFNEERADPARAKAADDAMEAHGEVTGNTNFFGWYNFSIVCFGETPDEAVALTDEVAARARAAGFSVVRETTHLFSAFQATIPGNWRDVQRWCFMGARNVSDIVPIRGVLSGESEAEYLSKQTKRKLPALAALATNLKTPYYFNFHVGDLGHAFVAGPSRSGKTTSMNFLLSQWTKYAPCRVIIFDKNYSCKIPTILQGGEHIDLAGDNANVRLNPISMVAKKEDWDFVARWIELLITSRGYKMTANDERSVREAIESVAISSPDNQCLMTIQTQLPAHLREHLDPWIGDKPLGRMFDNTEDSFALSDIVCIEMGEIMGNKRAARAFMDYAFHRIRRALEESISSGVVKPTIIYVEECWFLMEDEEFCDKIRDWLKTLAKLCANLVLTTQSIEDFVNSPVFPSIRDNIPTRLFLPNRNATNETLYEMYRKQFELTDRQIQAIRTGTRKKEFLLVQPGIARMVSLPLDDESVAVLRSDAAAQGVFEKWRTSGDPDWKHRYIEEVKHV